MSATTHTRDVCLPHGDPDLGAEVDLRITFTASKGSPAILYGDNMHPEEPSEIEFVSCVPLSNGKPSPPYGAFADLEQGSLDSLAEAYLESDDGIQQAFETVASDDEAAREYAAESRADR